MTDPDGITGLHGWYKADAITGLSNGAAVTQWNDSSGFVNHAAQATGTNQPTYQTNVINGLPVVRFDGGTDRLVITNTDMLAITNNAAGITMSAVVILSSLGALLTRNIFGLSVGGGGTTARVKFGSRTVAGPNLDFWAVSGRKADADTQQNVVSAGQSVTNTNLILTAVVDWANSNADVYQNGLNIASTAAWFTDGNSAATNSTAATIGSQASETELWMGDMAELVVYNKALNSTELGQLTSYYTAKYLPAPPKVYIMTTGLPLR